MDVKTRITRTRVFEKQLKKLPEHIRQKVILWVFLVESQSIWDVAKNPGFHDEPLRGERKGQRSVRMNKAYRIIYIVIKDRIHIELIEVNKHEY